MWLLFYGEERFFLCSFNKFLTLIVVVIGAVLGWFLNSFKSVREKSGAVMASKGYFGLVYMWFLVGLRRQGILNGTLSLGKHYLYVGDRG